MQESSHRGEVFVLKQRHLSITVGSPFRMMIGFQTMPHDQYRVLGSLNFTARTGAETDPFQSACLRQVCEAVSQGVHHGIVSSRRMDGKPDGEISVAELAREFRFHNHASNRLTEEITRCCEPDWKCGEPAARGR